MGRIYDESGFEQVLSWDPRLAGPGIVLALVSVIGICKKWPDVRAGLVVLTVAAILITVGLRARRRFRAEPGRYISTWQLGSLRSTQTVAADEARVQYRYHKGWQVFVKRGWTTYETFIHTNDETEVQQWVAFVQDVAAGKRPTMPEERR